MMQIEINNPSKSTEQKFMDYMKICIKPQTYAFQFYLIQIFLNAMFSYPFTAGDRQKESYNHIIKSTIIHHWRRNTKSMLKLFWIATSLHCLMIQTKDLA